MSSLTQQAAAPTRSAEDDALIAKARRLLQYLFGYESFRGEQERVILSLLKGNDTLAIMPTGQGKSLCYQIPAQMFSGLTLVVSPLIALMKDQVDSLKAIGYPAAAINSQTSLGAVQRAMLEIYQGKLKLLFVAPERLETRSFVSAMQGVEISLVAVDEAHCISEWGYDFRPSYQRIAEGIEAISPQKRPIMLALTATATEEVIEDIQTFLKLQSPNVIVGGFERPNLSLSVFALENKRQKLLQILNAVKGSAMVYAMSRKLAEETARFLQQHRIQAIHYHAGLPDEERSRIQEAFFRNEYRVVCATNAFGMGVNKPDVRVVVHLELPETLEAYYQEAGRAGRDGKKSYAVLLYSPRDLEKGDYLLSQSYPSKEEIEAAYDELRKRLGRSETGALTLERQDALDALQARFGKAFGSVKLDAALDILANANIIEHLRNDGETETLKILVHRDAIEEWIRGSRSETQRKVFEQVLRSFGGECFSSEVQFSLSQFAFKAGVDAKAALNVFREWNQSGLAEFRSGELVSVVVLAPNLNPKKLPIDWARLEKRRKVAEKKFRSVKNYVRYARCRRNYILDYFGETRYSEKCGICDNCLGRHEK
ncbi:MAG: RecQ family ATP-dependent DNA helicase [Chloroherpetonaceae bacterium]|nr:RecQ family ATP-dependent DNA helicase [Chloroherpetonaceae bacterium]MDW8437722.1 RecQ family ATP-dependent DNA helicase [Chloroherpetonaceae bacterium]